MTVFLVVVGVLILCGVVISHKYPEKVSEIVDKVMEKFGKK